MTDLMNHLYRYAQDNLIPGCLSRNREYQDSRTCAELGERALRAALPQAHRQKLDDLLGEQLICQWAMMEAAFQAGFSMSIDLNHG
ncbi:MAG TPA: hypothetical protein IAC21_08325 [Candidatus Enterenecus merdae]|nr:hypothetical protein [Candidatus Enterenecus merdae]